MADNVVSLQHPGPAPLPAYSGKQLDLIRRTVAKDCNVDEFDLFVEVCNRTGLDPFRRQIYAFVFNKDKPERRQLTIVTGIDGYRAIAQRNGDYRPASEPTVIEYDEALKGHLNPLGIVKATVTVHKGHGNDWYPVVGEAYWEEFVPINEEWTYDEEAKRRKPTGKRTIAKEAWVNMARIMIGKCAEAQALRRGWPEELSGVYAQEEIDQAMSLDVTATEAVAAYATEQRLKLTNAGKAIGFLWEAGRPIESVQLGQLADRCFAFIKASDSATQLETWRDTNRVGLQEFWARQAGEALEVKRALEARIAKLSTPADLSTEPDKP